jgi:hypothetical protein
MDRGVGGIDAGIDDTSHEAEVRRLRAILNDDEAIRVHRRAILNIWPPFATHLVFDDGKRGVQKCVPS